MSMSDSDDDAPLIARRDAKGAASAPAVKQAGTAAKPAAVKAEVKEEDAPGVKGPEAAAKGQDKKPPASKGKAAAKDDDAAQNGKAAAASKKVKEESKQPREKKEFDMPGQTREPPPETDALRKFYTSLLEQRPESEMAKKWCLTHGLLSREMAEELVAQLKKGKPAPKSPAKPSGRSEGKSASAATKTRRPAEKAPTAKRQRQAVSPPKKTRAKYSDEEDGDSSSSEEEDDDDDEPIRAKPAAKAAPKPAVKPAAGSKAPAKKTPVIKGQDKAFTDGGLGDSDDDDDDDIPLGQRRK